MPKYKYLNPPEGFTIEQAIEWRDLPRMKDYAMSLLEPHDPRYEQKKKMIEGWHVQEAQRFFKFNGFTFISRKEAVIKWQNNIE
jgi:hypothetical protein